MPVERLAWIDHAKGIGIFLVVYGHVARGLDAAGIMPLTGVLGTVDHALYSFHMPLFFLLAGCLFPATWSRCGSRRLLAAKVDTIAYPYVLWSLIHGGIELMTGRWINHPTTIGEVLSLAWAPRIHFWFLHALFLCFVVMSLLCVPSLRAGLIATGLLIAAGWLTAAHVPPVAVLGGLMSGLPYVLIGAIHGSAPRMGRFAGAATGATCAIAFVAFHALGGSDAVQSMGTHAMKGAAMLIALVGIGAVCAVSMAPRLPAARVLALLGRYSLEIYILHVLAAAGARIICERLIGMSDPLTHLVLGMVAGICLPLGIATVCESRGWTWCWRTPAPLALARRSRAATTTVAPAAAT